MKDLAGTKPQLAPDAQFALGSIFSNSSCGLVPTLDQLDIVGTYRSEDDSVLDFVPAALAARADFEQRQYS